MQEGGGCGPLKPGTQQAFPVCRRQAWVFSPVPNLPLPSHAFLAPVGKGWEYKSLLLCMVFLSLHPFSSAGDSIVFLFCNSGFASRPHGEPDKALQSPSCAQGSEQQPATSRGSFSFAWQTLGKNPSQTVYTSPMFGKWGLFQVQESEIYLTKTIWNTRQKPYPWCFKKQNHQVPWRRGRGNIQNYLWWGF